MSLRDFYLERRKAELPAFMKVLKALPTDQLSYKPHGNSSSAEQIVWLLTNELKVCLDAATEGKAEFKQLPPPPIKEMIEKFEEWSNALTERVSSLDDDAWNKAIPLSFKGKVVSEQPLGQFLWFIMFDAIHHRGQLSSYLRPMGGKVPAIYGPSADEPSRM